MKFFYLIWIIVLISCHSDKAKPDPVKATGNTPGTAASTALKQDEELVFKEGMEALKRNDGKRLAQLMTSDGYLVMSRVPRLLSQSIPDYFSTKVTMDAQNNISEDFNYTIESHMTSCDQAAFFGMWSKSITRKGQKGTTTAEGNWAIILHRSFDIWNIARIFVTTDTENFTF